MRGTLEEEEIAQPQQDREFTLSTTTLLAIFFGLVLVCALFFAFGYTLGRRSPSARSGAESSAESVPPASAPAQYGAGSPKPSAAAQSTSALAAPMATTQPVNSVAEAPPAPQVEAAETRSPEANQTGATNPAGGRSPTVAAPVGEPEAGVMVQIAAVSNPADADVLVSALHKRGYSVAVRRDPSDSLMHVQVGPFSNRSDAAAMRQKLLADGYNAILK